jgi:hypothetical protein
LCAGFAPVLLRRGIPYKDSPGAVLAGVVLGGGVLGVGFVSCGPGGQCNEVVVDERTLCSAVNNSVRQVGIR